MEEQGTDLKSIIASINKKPQDDRDARVFAAGVQAARGLPPGVATAEKLASRARALRALNPALTNVEATIMAYKEANIPLE